MDVHAVEVHEDSSRGSAKTSRHGRAVTVFGMQMGQPAAVSVGWHSPGGHREFVPVHLAGSPSRGYRAEPTMTPGTTGLLGLARANAVAVVPEDVRPVVAGDTLHCLLLDS